MTMNEDWKVFSWHCVNCGQLVQGLKNKDGMIKVECRTCHTAMIRVPKSRRTDLFRVTAPEHCTH